MGECLLKGEVNQPNPILLQATVENLQGKCRKGLPLVIKTRQKSLQNNWLPKLTIQGLLNHLLNKTVSR